MGPRSKERNHPNKRKSWFEEELGQNVKNSGIRKAIRKDLIVNYADCIFPWRSDSKSYLPQVVMNNHPRYCSVCLDFGAPSRSINRDISSGFLASCMIEIIQVLLLMVVEVGRLSHYLRRVLYIQKVVVSDF